MNQARQEFGDRHASVDRRIEQAGGWRLFMRQATDCPPSLRAQPDPVRIRSFPRAALAHAFVLAKSGEMVAARRQVAAFEDTWKGDLESDAALQADLVLVEAHVSAYEDTVFNESHAERLHWVLDVLPEDDLVGQALACNHLCTVSLHLGDFDGAQGYAERSIRLFRKDGAEFGSLHLHTHLGQIRMMRGDLYGAESQYREMEERLSRLPGDPTRLIAVGRVLRAEVAYEMNDLAASSRMLHLAMHTVEENDAWFDILAATYRVRTRLAHAEAGLPGALTALAHAERIARERAMPRLGRLMQIERIRALTLSDEVDAALKALQEIGLAPERIDWEETDDWALRQASTYVALARWLVRARRARQALALIEPAEDFAIRGGQLLSLAKLRVVAAAAYWKLNERAQATRALLSALRLLGRQPFRRFILDEGSIMRTIVQAALDGDHVSVPPTREQRRRLSELTHYWATHAGGTASQGAKGRREGPEALRRRYLALLALGHSNKEMARIMGVSVDTVKYHLKLVFRTLRVDNRTRAVQRARELGLLDR